MQHDISGSEGGFDQTETLNSSIFGHLKPQFSDIWRSLVTDWGQKWGGGDDGLVRKSGWCAECCQIKYTGREDRVNNQMLNKSALKQDIEPVTVPVELCNGLLMWTRVELKTKSARSGTLKGWNPCKPFNAKLTLGKKSKKQKESSHANLENVFLA